MQKKVLFTLLASPLAMTAFGATVDNVLTPNSGWTAVSGATTGFTQESGSVTVPPSVGSITQTYTLNLPGKYKFQFTGLNNCNAAVKVNGVALAANASEFTTDAPDATIEFTLSHIDNTKAFSFSSLSIVLDFDFEAAKSRLAALLGGVRANSANLLAEDCAELNAAAETLNSAAQSLAAAKTAVQAKIDGLSSEADYKTNYETYKLWLGDKSLLDGEIAEHTAAVAAHNTAVAEHNTKVANVNANRAAKAALDAYAAAANADQTALAARLTHAYYTEKAGEAVAAHKTAVEALAAAVTAAYADLTVDPATVANLDAAKKAVADAKTAADNAITKAVADLAAYEAALAKNDALDRAYRDANTKVQGVTSVDSLPNAFDSSRAARLLAINNAWEPLNQIAPQPKAEDGSWSAVVDTFVAQTGAATFVADAAKAITGMAQLAADFAELAQTQNTAWNNADKVLKEAEKNVADAKKAGYEFTLPDGTKLADALAAIRTAVNTAYGQMALTPEVYTADLQAVQSVLNEKAGFITANNRLADLKATVLGYDKELTAALKDTGFAFDLYSHFTGTFDNLAAAVASLKADPEKSNAEVLAAIDQCGADAKTLQTAVANTVTNYNGLNRGLEDFEASMTQKLVLGDYTVAQYKETEGYKDLTAKSAEFLTALNAALTAPNNQACLEQCIKVDGDLTAYGYQNILLEQNNAFQTAVTAANKTWLEGKLAALDTKTDEGTYFGQAKLQTEFDPINAKLASELQPLLDAAANHLAAPDEEATETDVIATLVADLKLADEKISEIAAEVAAQSTRVDSYKANDLAYNELQTGTDDAEGNFLTYGVADLDAKKQAAVDENAKAASAVQPHFTKVIGDVKLQALKDTLTAERDSITCAVNRAKLQGEIDAMAKTFDDIKADIVNNERSYKEQLAKSGTVRAAIDALVTAMNEAVGRVKNDNGEHADAATVAALEAQRDAVKAMRDATLLGYDKKSYDAYVKGAAHKDASLMTNYSDLNAAAETTFGEFSVAVGNAVDAANSAIRAEWNGLIADLDKTYRDAIGEYQNYQQLTNPALREALKALLTSHAHLFQYAVDIDKLNKDFVAEFYAAKRTEIIPSDVETEWKNKVAATKAALIDDRTTMTETVGVAADDFQTREFVRYANEYAATVAEMNVAGVTMTDALAQYEATLYKTFELDAPKAESARRVNGTAAECDHANATFHADHILNDAALHAKTLPGLVANAVAVQVVADKNDFDSRHTALEAELQALENVDSQKIADASWIWTSGLLDLGAAPKNLEQYTAWSQAYNALWTAYETAVNQLKAESLANTNSIAWRAEAEAFVAELEGKRDDFKAFAATLAADVTAETAAVENALQQIQSELRRNNLFAEANKTAVEGFYANGTEAAKQAYVTIFDKEQIELHKLGKKAQEAYNNAAKAGVSTEVLDANRPVIAAEIAKIPLLTNDLTADSEYSVFETRKAECTAIEAALSDAVMALDGARGEDPLTPVVSGLETKFQAALDTVAAYKAELENDNLKKHAAGAYESYLKQYDDYAAAIAAQKQTMEALGNRMLLEAYTARFENALGEILAVAEAKRAAVNAHIEWADNEQARWDASDARKLELQAELDAEQAHLNTYAGYLADYGLAEGDITVASVQALIDAMQQTLDAYAATHALTAEVESTFFHIDDVRDNIDNYTIDAAGAHWDGIHADVMAKYEVAAAAINGKLVTEDQPGLQARLGDINTAIVTNRHDKGVAVTDLQQTIAERKAAIDALAEALGALVPELETLAVDIADATYMLGDINRDKSVDVLDVQQIVNWVGEAKTLDDLFENEGHAVSYAANVNGDGMLNIADATGALLLALGEQPAGARHMLPRGVMAGSEYISLQSVSTAEGVTRYAVLLNNGNQLSGGQFDLQLPSGLELVDVVAGDRSASHSAAAYANADGLTRVVVFSMQNEVFAGNEGAVLYIDVRGNGTLKIDNAVFSTPEAQAIEVGTPKPLSIDSLREDLKSAGRTIYNVAGQMVRGLQRGINIIRHSDGSVTKEKH